MLKRLRAKHPVGFCVLSEVLFLGSLLLGSYLIVFALVLFWGGPGTGGRLFPQRHSGGWWGHGGGRCSFWAAPVRCICSAAGAAAFSMASWWACSPVAMICYTLYGKLLFGMPTDRPLRTGWQIAWYFIGMFTVGVAEEFLFRGVIAQTLLEHFGTSRAGIWKACLLCPGFFRRAHLTNLLSSAPFGVLMQCVFAGSLGVLFAAIYFRTGNLWVLVFLHGAQDAASLLAGGLYGTENMSTAVSSYDSTMLLSVLVYLIPTFSSSSAKRRSGK